MRLISNLYLVLEGDTQWQECQATRTALHGMKADEMKESRDARCNLKFDARNFVGDITTVQCSITRWYKH